MNNKEKFIDAIVHKLDDVIDCHHCPVYKDCHSLYTYEMCTDTLRRWLNNTYKEVQK